MHPGVIEVGHNNPGRWRHIAETYAEFGMMPQDFDLSGFIYDPNPRPDLRWLYWSLAGLGMIAVGALGWALPLYVLNRRLRRAKEAAEAANLAKSRYLAVMSHEVRTPLGGVIGLVNLLQTEPLTREQRESVNLIARSSEDLLRLIDGVLDYAQMEEGRMKPRLETLAVRPFAYEMAELFRGAARAKGLTLDCKIDDAVPPAMHTDPLRLRQILSNLLANAVKFTGQGGVALHVTGGAGGRLYFRVSDSGIGLSPEQVGNLFEPYSQADATIGRRYGGSGLGLSIARQLARLLGGDITVESTAGEGAVFIVEIDAGTEVVAGGSGRRTDADTPAA